MTRLVALIGLLLLPASAMAQDAASAPKTYDEMWRAIAQRIVAERLKSDNLALPLRVGQIIRLQSTYTPFLLYVKAKSSTLGLLGEFEEARTDKQVGAPANTAGGTSLVAKGAAPSILGFAVENGALTQSSTETSATFRGTLLGWLDLLHNQGFINSYEDEGGVVRALRAVSYSFTLDTSPKIEPVEEEGSGLSPGAVTAQFEQIGKQLTNYSIRVALYDQRDPRRTANRQKISSTLLSKGIEINTSLNFLDPLANSTDYTEWLLLSQDMLAAPGLSEADILRILGQRVERLRQMAIDRLPDLSRQVDSALNAFAAYNKARLEVFKSLQKRPLVTVELVTNRQATLPDQRTLRLIGEGQWGPRLDLTANFAWNFQQRPEEVLPGTTESGRLRDFQAAVQAEFALGSRSTVAAAGSLTKPSLAFAYLAQDVKPNAAVSFGGKTFAVAPGMIHVAQAKLTIPAKGSGVKVPLSVSWSNRTELIQEKTVRAHIGVTWDFDAFTAGFLRR